MGPEEERLIAERDKHEDWLSRQEGVTGIGIGIGQGARPVIKVYTNRMPEGTKSHIRSVLTSVPVEFEETGEFRAF
mgnify:CR=1 FL=1